MSRFQLTKLYRKNKKVRYKGPETDSWKTILSFFWILIQGSVRQLICKNDSCSPSHLFLVEKKVNSSKISTDTNMVMFILWFLNRSVPRICRWWCVFCVFFFHFTKPWHSLGVRWSSRRTSALFLNLFWGLDLPKCYKRFPKVSIHHPLRWKKTALLAILKSVIFTTWAHHSTHRGLFSPICRAILRATYRGSLCQSKHRKPSMKIRTLDLWRPIFKNINCTLWNKAHRKPKDYLKRLRCLMVEVEVYIVIILCPNCAFEGFGKKQHNHELI